MGKANSNTTILIAAGASGGHLFPALAVAEKLKTQGITCVFLVGGSKFAEKITDAGFVVENLPASAFNVRNPIRKLKALINLARAWWKALGLINKHHPSAIFGTGGYATVATVLAAKTSGVPVVLHEQNVLPGRANKFLAKWADNMAITFPKSADLLNCEANKIHLTGNPIRQDIVTAVSNKSKAKKYLQLVVLGGSQGAWVLSDVVPDAVSLLPENVLKNLQIIHQSRPEDVEKVTAIYAKLSLKNLAITTFINNMPQVLAESDLVVARAGTSTLVEVSMFGIPAIYVPLLLADGHQMQNAQVVEKAGAGVIIEQDMFTPETLLPHLKNLLEDEEQRQQMGTLAKILFKTDAAKKVAKLVLETAKTDIITMPNN